MSTNNTVHKVIVPYADIIAGVASMTPDELKASSRRSMMAEIARQQPQGNGSAASTDPDVRSMRANMLDLIAKGEKA